MSTKLKVPGGQHKTTYDNIKTINEDNKMSIRFQNAKQPRKLKFMGEDVTIFKLTISQVKQIQAFSKDAESSVDYGNLAVLVEVIKLGCPELADCTLEFFDEFPLDDLNNLSAEIMKFSGLTNK